jgi:hypothetical protein
MIRSIRLLRANQLKPLANAGAVSVWSASSMSFFSVLGWAGPQVKLYVPAGRYFLEQLACRPMSDGDMDEKNRYINNLCGQSALC